MPELLAAVWFASAVGGVIAALAGVFGSRSIRPRSFTIAGVCFAVAGVLGILSIGILFLVLSGACFIFGRRVRDGSRSTPAHL